MTGRWALRTASTTYSVGLGLDGSALLLKGWSPSGDPPPPVWTPPPDAAASWELDSDHAPMEVTSLGTADLVQPDLVVDHGDGLLGTRWVFRGHEHQESGDRDALVVRFVDSTGTVALDLHTETARHHDVVRRWTELSTTGDRTVTARRAMTGGWNVPAPHGVRIDYLAGRWAREFGPERVDLRAGSLHLGSRQGITSHQFAPVVHVRPLAEDGEVDAALGTYSFALAWSGSWSLVAEARPGRVRVSLGHDQEALAVPLVQGERMRLPDLLGLRVLGDVEAASREWHHYQRTVLSRGTGPEHRPVVYNSWYATGFDVRPDHQVELADAAAGMGVEVFVVDDGWFCGRRDDTAGLGDWVPDPESFPQGLGKLADAVIDRGLRFGLWVEPEAVNPDSDLFRAHPDWVYRAGDRPLTTMRNQLVLDLGRPEVVEWVESMLRDLLRAYPISYLKWDMNRPVTDGGRPGDPRSCAWSLDHAHGYHRVMSVLRSEFPHVTIEACAGGGGRIDPAVLAVSDVVWPSDETGPRDRLVIQDGFLRAFPPHVMSSWVTDEPDRLDTRPTSFGFRFVVATAGVLGIGGDLLAWSDEQLRDGAGLVELYKQIRPVLHEGAVTRVGNPHTGLHSVQYAGDERHGGRVVVLVWDCRDVREPGPTRLRVPAAEADHTYRLPGGRTLPGDVLAREGLVVPWSVAPDADVIVLDPIDTLEVA